MMNSLDPRVNRLPVVGEEGKFATPKELDQFTTFEVFVQPKEGKPFQHEGIVHAPNISMAWVLAKETFTRRFTCVSMYVTDSRSVLISPMTEGSDNAYNLIPDESSSKGAPQRYEIFHLLKRGKQHQQAGQVEAVDGVDVFVKAKKLFNSEKPIHSVWAIKTEDILFTPEEETDLWLTLPEKKFRDAVEYKGGEKLKVFLESRS